MDTGYGNFNNAMCTVRDMEAAGIAGGCCILICIGTITAQCVVRRRKRMKELKAQKDLAELEGMEMAEVSSSIKSDTDDPDGKDPDSKK